MFSAIIGLSIAGIALGVIGGAASLIGSAVSAADKAKQLKERAFAQDRAAEFQADERQGQITRSVNTAQSSITAVAGATDASGGSLLATLGQVERGGELQSEQIDRQLSSVQGQSNLLREQAKDVQAAGAIQGVSTALGTTMNTISQAGNLPEGILSPNFNKPGQGASIGPTGPLSSAQGFTSSFSRGGANFSGIPSIPSGSAREQSFMFGPQKAFNPLAGSKLTVAQATAHYLGGNY